MTKEVMISIRGIQFENGQIREYVTKSFVAYSLQESLLIWVVWRN